MLQHGHRLPNIVPILLSFFVMTENFLTWFMTATLSEIVRKRLSRTLFLLSSFISHNGIFVALDQFTRDKGGLGINEVINARNAFCNAPANNRSIGQFFLLFQFNCVLPMLHILYPFCIQNWFRFLLFVVCSRHLNEVRFSIRNVNQSAILYQPGGMTTSGHCSSICFVKETLEKKTPSIHWRSRSIHSK